MACLEQHREAHKKDNSMGQGPSCVLDSSISTAAGVREDARQESGERRRPQYVHLVVFAAEESETVESSAVRTPQASDPGRGGAKHSPLMQPCLQHILGSMRLIEELLSVVVSERCAAYRGGEQAPQCETCGATACTQ